MFCIHESCALQERKKTNKQNKKYQQTSKQTKNSSVIVWHWSMYMPDSCTPKQLLLVSFPIGNAQLEIRGSAWRTHWRPHWSPSALTPQHRKTFINKGCQTLEERRTVEAQQKWEWCKSRVASTSTTIDACPSRSYCARIGLISHLRKYRKASSSTQLLHSTCHLTGGINSPETQCMPSGRCHEILKLLTSFIVSHLCLNKHIEGVHNAF